MITVGETPNVTTAPQAYEPDPDVIPNVELTVNIVERIDCCWILWDAIPVTVPILTSTIADRKKKCQDCYQEYYLSAHAPLGFENFEKELVCFKALRL